VGEGDKLLTGENQVRDATQKEEGELEIGKVETRRPSWEDSEKMKNIMRGSEKWQEQEMSKGKPPGLISNRKSVFQEKRKKGRPSAIALNQKTPLILKKKNHLGIDPRKKIRKLAQGGRDENEPGQGSGDFEGNVRKKGVFETWGQLPAEVRTPRKYS